ncbi:MAG: DNA polymerase I, partial [Rhodocyclaceae bacterium]|nr:DNA polymerase I [Rhodocyclaceae bacterium]
ELSCTVVQDWATLEQWLQRVRTATLVALDAETTSLDAMQARLVGLSLAVQPGQAAYIPLAHEGQPAPAQLPLHEVLQRLRPWLEDAAAPKCGQHIKYDL